MKMRDLFKQYIERLELQKQLTAEVKQLREQILVGLENRNAMKAGDYTAIVKDVERRSLDKNLVIGKFGEDEIQDCFKLIVYKKLNVVNG